MGVGSGNRVRRGMYRIKGRYRVVKGRLDLGNGGGKRMSLVVRLRGEGTWVGLGRWGIGSSLHLRLLSAMGDVAR